MNIAPGRSARASVVIPAHNEAATIGRCLDSLQASGEPLEVIVVPNGCTDDTALRAARNGVTVVESDRASKAAALNLGDATASVFPRIYLDGDVEVEPGLVTELIETLSTSQPRIAVPSVRYDTSRSTRVVKLFYETLTTVRQGGFSGGRGLYAVSEAGRARFGEFPDMIGDDLFVTRLFAPSEQVITSSSTVVHAPHDGANLVKIRTRVAQGNAQLAARDTASTTEAPNGSFERSTSGTLKMLGQRVLAKPTQLPSAATFVVVGAVARARARRSSATAWERDGSTREKARTDHG